MKKIGIPGSEQETKIIVVSEDSIKNSIIKGGNEPYWYVDHNGYYISKWKEGDEIEIIQVEAIGKSHIAYEYVISK